MISRRSILLGAGATAMACICLQGKRAAAKVGVANLEKRFASIEAKTGGRLGVAMHDTGSGLKAARTSAVGRPVNRASSSCNNGALTACDCWAMA